MEGKYTLVVILLYNLILSSIKKKDRRHCPDPKQRKPETKKQKHPHKYLFHQQTYLYWGENRIGDPCVSTRAQKPGILISFNSICLPLPKHTLGNTMQDYAKTRTKNPSIFV